MNTLNFGAITPLGQDEAADTDLGPLAQLQGTWTSAPSPATGYNVIAVPGPPNLGFVLETIPYSETLTFSPVVLGANRGLFNGATEDVQKIVGLKYDQVIISACENQQCIDRGFPKGAQIHVETGLFLYLTNSNNGFELARLSTIPHGNSLLALGNTNTVSNPANFIPNTSALPHPNPNPGQFGYFDRYGEPFLFPQFDPGQPNLFLQETIKNQKITSLTTLDLSTKNATGGVLNTPFIQTNINATQVDSTFWIETLADNTLQLQYSQNINLIFPPTGSNVMVNWPHITVNTLTKINS